MTNSVLERGTGAPAAQEPTVEQAADRMLQVLPALFKQLWSEMRLTAPARAGEVGETQFRIVHTLKHRECTIGEMATCMQVRTPTISRMIDSLVERGLVERQSDPDDRRKVWLRLSPAGRALADSGEARFHGAVARLLEPLGAAQLRQLIMTCDTLEGLLVRATSRELKLEVSQEEQL